eukprot:GILK01002394.1.p1 GENE.GILK01002394.1~~GILK01002394.1.p1  ORF type:complete len:431 (-),score=36.89 GILK01002394.1:260-1552(-)
MSKPRVSYFYDANVGTYYYGAGHPMKPHRLRMAHQLILNYGLYKKMEVYKPHWASEQEMAKFHSPEYLDFLRRINPENVKEFIMQMQRFNVGEFTDCPIFEGLFPYTQIYTGGSIDGATKLNHGLSDIAVNWAGGLHHAKKSEASGFCYINDIVLSILELLKYHARVLYVDIDIHHGDGVEEAFYVTDRVMTVSFHKFGDFFPGTGDVKDVGTKSGKYYAVNVPLREGMDDRNFERIFKPVMQKVMEIYRPGAIVMQCGADSLTGDRLGCFNLTVRGHAECVRFMKSFGLPMLLLGGGGYTIRNVARCWTYETAVVLDQEISDDLPYNDFYEYFGPDYKLHLQPNPNQDNANSRDYLDKIKVKVLENLRCLQGAPGVQMHEIPPDFFTDEHDEDSYDADTRHPEQVNVRRRDHESEFYDDDKDQDHDGDE